MQKEWSQEEWREWVDHPISRGVRSQIKEHLYLLGQEAISGVVLKGSDITHEYAGVLVGRAAMCREILEMMSEDEDGK